MGENRAPGIRPMAAQNHPLRPSTDLHDLDLTRTSDIYYISVLTCFLGIVYLAREGFARLTGAMILTDRAIHLLTPLITYFKCG